jgi:hypothetical protein
MKGKYIAVICLVAAAFLACGCAGYDTTTDRTPLGIVADRQSYTPLMSSTVGIGLTPEYPSGIDNTTVSFRWQADYGYFLSWDAPDFKVTNTGRDVTTTDKKVFWSYDPDEMGKDKPTAHVTLSMVDTATGRTLNKTSLEIGWENKDLAIILNGQ